MSIFKHRCDNNNHRFEARYSYGASTIEIETKYTSVAALERLLDSFRSKTYIYDICIHCGKIAINSRLTKMADHDAGTLLDTMI